MPANSPRVPELRVVARNPRAVRKAGDYVLYWMTANRRTGWNFALDRAVELAAGLDKPLLVFEALRVGYRWNSDRLHRFVLDGMRANHAACAAAGVAYYPYVEPEEGAGSGLLEALAQRAAVVVTDDFPCFFLPRMVASAAAKLPVLLESVDANGLLPMRAAEAPYPTAYAFRRFLQKSLKPHLLEAPLEHPLEAAARLGDVVAVAPGIEKRWPRATAQLLEGDAGLLAALPIDHAVRVAPKTGGSEAAALALRQFVRHKLPRYAEERGDVSEDIASGFSPWLHFGHLSTHQILASIARIEAWTPARIATTTSGKKDGWWNLSPSGEAFLDELVTWRELGFNLASKRDDHDRYESLPAWARQTLDEHTGDRREHVYSLEEFERAETHDELWNCAQRQLVREGRIHNYLRMLWGKKILEWTRDPRAALEVMIELNNRWALDGRDPNSYSGILWTLGRYDRPWGPVRKIFGTIRYMSSDNTARKMDVKPYLGKFAASAS
ncbi:MAG: deoxyribodipyrimidine photolyase [Planctomycetota bacterium]|nr:deoxyribodipyrimidine photolyase [Planctomycetota bacterium]